jgi:two-component system chemotaxis response regulator CheB
MPKVRQGPIRVVVIDDSPTVRELLVAILQAAGGIQVVGSGATGEDAVRLTRRLRPDVVTMDIMMPKMDGLEATRAIMREVPTPIVIVTGSLMHADENLTFKALQAGALTVIATPGLADPETCDTVVRTVRLMSEVAVVHRWSRREGKPPAVMPVADLLDSRRNLQIVGVASSTGGPAALAVILKQVPPDFPWPILVVQHVTSGFTAGLAEWLDGETALRVVVASHGDVPRAGAVWLAPDDYHMKISARGIIELSKESAYKGLRPSANYLFHSLARAYGPRALGIVLTGMGDDGAEGLAALHAAGGAVIAQDEQSCVVYGMPREAINRNIVDQVLPLDQIGPTLGHLKQHQAKAGVK